jgi:excisionase family DNA binding protein
LSRAMREVPEDIQGRTWTNDEAARYIGVTPATLRVWVSRRRVPFVRVGRLVRFRRSDLDKYLDRNLVSPS